MKPIIAALGMAFLPLSPAFADIQSSPLRVYPTSPFQANTLATQLRSAFPSERLELFASGTISSVWAHSNEFDLDYYQNQALVGAQWRVNERLSAELKYQYSWAANNHLDSLTISFHDLFNIGQNGREDVGKHQFNIDSEEYDVHINDFEGETMSRAVHGYLRYQLYNAGPHALSIGGTLYYNNVDDGPFAESSFEQGMQINYSMVYGPNALFSTFGVTHRGDDDLLTTSFPVKSFSSAWALGYGRRLGRAHEVLLQYHGFEGVMKDNSDFAEASHEVVLGYRYHFPMALFELSMTENIVNMDNSTDIAFSTGLRFFL